MELANGCLVKCSCVRKKVQKETRQAEDRNPASDPASFLMKMLILTKDAEVEKIQNVDVDRAIEN